MRLENKVAVIYGAGGSVGGAVARAFAREGATLFLTGRNRSSVEAVADEIVSEGGSAETAEIDALSEQAVDGHLQSAIEKAGRVDISFNAVGIRNTTLQGVPLAELDVEQFTLPIATYTRSYFVTARLAARRMVLNRSGVIMTVTSTPARTGIPLMGGVGPAMSAVESLTRVCPLSSRPTAFESLGCGLLGCRSRARSRKSMGSTPKHAESRGSSFGRRSQAGRMRDGFRHSRRWPTLQPSWLPTRRAG